MLCISDKEYKYLGIFYIWNSFEILIKSFVVYLFIVCNPASVNHYLFEIVMRICLLLLQHTLRLIIPYVYTEIGFALWSTVSSANEAALNQAVKREWILGIYVCTTTIVRLVEIVVDGWWVTPNQRSEVLMHAMKRYTIPKYGFSQAKGRRRHVNLDVPP